MTVAVMPSLFVAVVAARRDQAIEHFGQVALQARLKLDRADRRRAAHAEHLDDARFDTRPTDDRGDLIGDIDHVPVARRLEGELFLVDHGSYPWGSVRGATCYRRKSSPGFSRCTSRLSNQQASSSAICPVTFSSTIKRPTPSGTVTTPNADCHWPSPDSKENV